MAKESTNEALEQWNKEACIPNAMTQTAVNHLYKVMLDKNLDQSLVLTFVSQLVRDDRNSINNTNCNEAFIKILSKDTMEAEAMASIASKAVEDDIMDIRELFDIVRNSAKSGCKILFISLSNLCQCWGQERLLEAFETSGVKLVEVLPETSEKTECVLAKLLSDHGLTFLMPLLSLKKEMESHVGNPTDLASWIGQHVDSKYHNNSDFILALFQVKTLSILPLFIVSLFINFKLF